MIRCTPRRPSVVPCPPLAGLHSGLDLTLFERQMFKLRLAIDLQALH